MADQYSDKDFVDVIDEDGTISSVPSAWLKDGGKHLLPPGTKKATEANVRSARAKQSAAAGDTVDVDQLRADIEAEVKDEHEKQVADLTKQLEDAQAALEAASTKS